MNQKLRVFGISFLALGLLFTLSTKAFALTPTLSLAGTGDGDTVQISVSGDPNTSVLLIYTKTGAGQQISSIGTTNSNGTLLTSISSSNYGIASGALVNVAMGSINGPQSSSIAWPNVAATLASSNMLSLSQTGLVLSIGQSATISASNLNSSSLYLSSNSNPVIANFSVSGSQITVTANSYGSTTGTFCLINNSSNCGSVYVIVQNGSAQALTFSQSSVSISSGQTISVQISGGSGSYSVLNNSSQNGGVVQTGISGSNITLTTTSTTGSSSITVCSTDQTSCGIINVTIGTANNSAISFSQSAPTVGIAQSLNVSIFGPTNSLFYVASNSSPNVVQANLSGSTLSLLGITNGSSTLSICASTSNCASLTVTVTSNSSSGGSLMLSQDSVTMSVGQTTNITISGGAMPYSILSNSTNFVQTTLNSNILSLYALSNGVALINVCSAGGNCATLSVNINASGISSLPVGCLSTSGYSQITGQSCSSTSVVTPVINIPADCVGTNQYSTSTGILCTNYAGPVVTSSTPVTTTTTFTFTKALKVGSTGAEVIQLQQKLKTLGFYTGKIDGGFGPITEKAVKAFQKAHSLEQVGNVGPLTRALLNK